MRLLDLFCGAGGAAVGYHQAGFDDIVGVDIVPQPNYPFTFIQADALEPPVDLDGFDLIHASPPCQVHSDLRSVQAADYDTIHVDLVDSTRQLLKRSGVDYIIENVPKAPLVAPFQLCGTGFGLTTEAVGVTWELRRHRIFESSTDVWAAPQCQHRHRNLGIYGHLARKPRPNNPARRSPFGNDGLPANDWKAGITDAERLMGIDWMTPKELVQAIPPAYTKFIGEQFLAQAAA